MSFVFFAIHLVLVGYLVYKSGYIPKPVGILLVIAGLGYLIQNPGPYLFPQADLGLVSISLLGELIFMFWLLIRGPRIKDQIAEASR